ncbi:DUF4145 domain-containing protein [Alkalibacterium thalassium]|uniref:DUF4145 domain-containing protein n=1 Tax=Alkalibacterium thalassium TaxID=426701 RepID=A0A1G8VQW9_9LACT|nr:DUF4145 domain-containing protein [Alkalibacterium thalassium]SDJ68374.1 protein of unknown function [Alkalibacterium thalassium]
MDYIKEFGHRWKGDNYMKQNDFTCGYCNRHTSSNTGLMLYDNPGSSDQHFNHGVYVCTYCNMPTFLWRDIQVPGNKFGNPVTGVSDTVSQLYDEARKAFSVNSYTAVLLVCRKLLMHIAVELGAETDKNFLYYVNFLRDENFITAKSDKWVDAIRKYGNQATHEVNIATREEAERIIKFTEMILKTNFEYPAMMEDTE